MAVPDLPTDARATKFDLPGGVILDGDLAGVRQITSHKDPAFREGVEESIAHAWYDGDWQRHPFDEETKPKPGEFDAAKKYSWVKAPRYQDKVMQVGPLAQVLVGYALGHERTVRWTDRGLALAGAVAKTKLDPSVLHSTIGRHLARAVRAGMLAELALDHWHLLVENIGRGDTAIFNEPHFPAGEIRGVGLHEAPRGLLSHWVVIKDSKIANYQAVVPSTWNAGPRDGKERPGPYEASLLGTPVADAERPLEALRTIHSFDPCLACAVHTHDADGREIARVKVL